MWLVALFFLLTVPNKKCPQSWAKVAPLFNSSIVKLQMKLCCNILSTSLPRILPISLLYEQPYRKQVKVLSFTEQKLQAGPTSNSDIHTRSDSNNCMIIFFF